MFSTKPAPNFFKLRACKYYNSNLAQKCKLFNKFCKKMLQCKNYKICDPCSKSMVSAMNFCKRIILQPENRALRKHFSLQNSAFT